MTKRPGRSHSSAAADSSVAPLLHVWLPTPRVAPYSTCGSLLHVWRPYSTWFLCATALCDN